MKNEDQNPSTDPEDILTILLLELAQEDPVFRRRFLVATLGEAEVTRIEEEARAGKHE